jgi:hypothetical protein
MDSKKIYVGLLIIFAASASAAVFFRSFPGNGVETLAGVPAIAALFGALFQLGRDSMAHQRSVQLESHKALLQQGSRIHERQIDALLSIHSKLEEALFYLQRAAGPGRFRGEASDEELLSRMARALGTASEQFSNNRLLISETLGQKLDDFFNKMFSGATTLTLALDPMVAGGNARATLVDQAREIAFKEIPLLLAAIRTEARTVIHGE